MNSFVSGLHVSDRESAMVKEALQFLIEEAGFSRVMLESGVLSEFAKFMKKILPDSDDPFSSIVKFTSAFDSEVSSVLERGVVKFLSSKRKLVKEAWRSNIDSHNLHYCIVLKNDSIKAENEVDDFVDNYEALDISKKYPIQFFFVPEKFIPKMNLLYKLDLDAKTSQAS